jgi:hypothetical protein
VVKRPKYGNRKTTVDGIIFDSAKESRRYSELVLLQKAGHISKLERQKCFVLAPAVLLGGRKKPALRYVADFFYVNSDGIEIVEDVKSKATAENRAFRIKQHLVQHLFGIEVLIT